VIKNRGVTDTFFLVCDGLKGLPDAVEVVWPKATVQTCILHLIRNTFRYASKKNWDELKRDVLPIYTAPSLEAAERARDAMFEKWGKQYPAIQGLWENAWEQFTPFLQYDTEICKVICSTNAIESLNARFRRSVRARGHFPTEQAALKCLYLTVRSLDPTGRGQVRWTMRWKPALNAFAITFADRWPDAKDY
jgi:transposase-like protein